MKLLIRLLALVPALLYNYSAHGQFTPQAQHTCAETRLHQSSSKMAVATPGHQHLMNQYDVTFYALDLNLERNSVYIAGSVQTYARVKNSPLNVFAFELHPNFTIDAVTINGVLHTNIIRNGSDVAVQLTTPAPPNSSIQATIVYRGSAPGSGGAAIGNGFSTAYVNNWQTNVTWSLSEPYAAYEWWPTKQVLTDKADSVHVTIRTRAENKAGSNGILTKTEALPDGRVAYHWKSKYPIDYYLISVAVSDYEEYVQLANPAGVSKPVPIVNYIYKGSLNVFKQEIDRTAGFLEYFSELFTLYPFAAEKYGHSMAPIGGGMEHQTMTTQSTFTFTLTAHELAHQWFGDNVTCATWQDIWLNEGFASYAEYLAYQHFEPATAKLWLTDAQNRARQATTGSLRVPDTTNVSRIFNYNITYKKGAAVVHMLRHEINDDALFFEALRNYQQQFAGKTATTADLQQVLQTTTAKNLDYFFEQWYKGEGYPVFNVQWNQVGEQLVLEVQQTTTGATPFFKTDLPIQLQTTTGTQVVRVTQTRPMQQFVFPVQGFVNGVLLDPENWVLKLTNQVARNTALQIPELQPVVYPNPAHNQPIVTIADIAFTPTQLIIYDRSGRKMEVQDITGQQQPTARISHIPAGLYFIWLTDGQQTAVTRLLKL